MIERRGARTFGSGNIKALYEAKEREMAQAPTPKAGRDDDRTRSARPPKFALTDDEQALLPDDDDVRFYAEHGWYLTKKLFADEEVDALVGGQRRYYAGERSRTLPVRPPSLAAWKPSRRPGAAAQRLRARARATRSPGSCASR